MKMEIYCKQKRLLDLAIMHSKALSVDSKDAVVHIKRLPPQFTQKGLIEYPRTIGKRTYIDIFIKMDDEKEITLAHEMMHVHRWDKEQPGERTCACTCMSACIPLHRFECV